MRSWEAVGNIGAVCRGLSAKTNQAEAVNPIRHLFQETMEADFGEAGERLTGQTVLAFISGNHIDPDIAAELFILDGPPGKPDTA